MKRKPCKYLALACILAIILSVTAFAVPVPEEPETPNQPETALPGALTPDGNLTLVDDIVQGDKQFITVQSKNGNYFYLVVDRSGEEENVYFLNLVDESDLLALIEEEPVPEKTTCICTEPCIGGTINHNCPVCDIDTAMCQAEVAETDTKEPAEVENPEESDPEEPAEETPVAPETTPFPWAIVITIVGLLVIGTVYYFKFLHKKSQAVPTLPNDENEYEIPEDDEASTIDEENPEDTVLY